MRNSRIIVVPIVAAFVAVAPSGASAQTKVFTPKIPVDLNMNGRFEADEYVEVPIDCAQDAPSGTPNLDFLVRLDDKLHEHTGLRGVMAYFTSQVDLADNINPIARRIFEGRKKQFNAAGADQISIAKSQLEQGHPVLKSNNFFDALERKCG